jgi:hypothetical protein
VELAIDGELGFGAVFLLRGRRGMGCGTPELAGCVLPGRGNRLLDAFDFFPHRVFLVLVALSLAAGAGAGCCSCEGHTGKRSSRSLGLCARKCSEIINTLHRK